MSLISYTHFPGVEDTETGRASVFILNFQDDVKVPTDSKTSEIYGHFGDCILWGDIIVFQKKGVAQRYLLVNYNSKDKRPYSFVDVTDGDVPLSFLKIKEEINKDFWNLPEAPSFVAEFIDKKGLFRPSP
jgi:hypothetical protein